MFQIGKPQNCFRIALTLRSGHIRLSAECALRNLEIESAFSVPNLYEGTTCIGKQPPDRLNNLMPMFNFGRA